MTPIEGSGRQADVLCCRIPIECIELVRVRHRPSFANRAPIQLRTGQANDVHELYTSSKTSRGALFIALIRCRIVLNVR